MLASRNINLAQMQSPEGTSPESPAASGASQEARNLPPQSKSLRPVRPSHGRSRSYLSGLATSFDPQLRNPGPPLLKDNGSAKESGYDSSASSILPRIHLPGHKSRRSQDVKNENEIAHLVGKDHRLHLPGRSHSHHRHTRSEVPQPKVSADNISRSAEEGTDYSPVSAKGVPGRVLTKVASNLSGRNAGQQSSRANHQFSASEHQRGWLHGNVASGSHRRPDVLRRRATSDPRAPSWQGVQNLQGPAGNGIAAQAIQDEDSARTGIEILLEKADQVKARDRLGTEEDVNHLSMQLAEANVELQNRLTDLSRLYTSFMRRLDEASLQLSSTGTALVDTISSFQNLTQQMQALVENFEQKSHDLNKEVTANLDKQRTSILTERGAKIAELGQRGQRANTRAQEMSRRLENCRTIVRNYTERQQTKQRAWKGVLLGSLWGLSIIVFGLVFGFALWWSRKHGFLEYGLNQASQNVLQPLADDFVGREDAHQQIKQHFDQQNSATYQSDILERVPEDVKELLEDIRQRHNTTQMPSIVSSSQNGITHADEPDKDIDGFFRSLDR